MRLICVLLLWHLGLQIVTGQDHFTNSDYVLKMININSKHPLSELESCIRTIYTERDPGFFSDSYFETMSSDTTITYGSDTINYSNNGGYYIEYVKQDSFLIVESHVLEDSVNIVLHEEYEFNSRGQLVRHSRGNTNIVVDRIELDSVVYTYSYEIESKPIVDQLFAKYGDDGFPSSVSNTIGAFVQRYSIEYANNDTLIYGPKMSLDENRYGFWSDKEDKNDAQKALNLMELNRRGVENKLVFKKPSGGFDFYSVGRSKNSDNIRNSYYISKDDRLVKTKYYKDGKVRSVRRFLYNDRGDIMRNINSSSREVSSKIQGPRILNYLYDYDGIYEGEYMKGEAVMNILTIVRFTGDIKK